MAKIQKYEKDNNQGINPLVAAVTGAAIGVGVTIGGALVLNDKKNRGKVKKALNDAKNQAIGYVEDFKISSKDKKPTLNKKTVKQIKKPAQKTLPKSLKKNEK